MIAERWVTRDELGGEWPFAIDRCLVRARHARRDDRVHLVAITIETEAGEVYALNGTVKDTKVHPPIDDVSFSVSDQLDLKPSVHPIIKIGLSL